MIFLTKFNLERLLHSLRIKGKIDYSEIKVYDLQQFGIDPSYLTKYQQQKIIICSILLNVQTDIEWLVKPIHQTKSHWIFTPKQPAYHTNLDCENINSNFRNIHIPDCLPENLIEDYRQFFLDNYENYSYRDGKKDPSIFGRMILKNMVKKISLIKIPL